MFVIIVIMFAAAILLMLAVLIYAVKKGRSSYEKVNYDKMPQEKKDAMSDEEMLITAMWDDDIDIFK